MNYLTQVLGILLLFLTCYEAAVIRTQYGFVEGTIKTTETGVTYHTFYGIPYARPPIGGLRFRDPAPPLDWHNHLPLNCTVPGPPFWGFNGLTGAIEGDFDALHVNIYTNNLRPETQYPVMVWIHGGGWQSGSVSTDLYGPDYLVEHDVIIVAINYRLGAFGFLSLDDPELYVPGNQAFKDQRMALRWIQRNIAYFGGDPNRVTLFGQSSGGGSVHYHMISESSRGLFQQGILMAGSALHNGYSVIPRLNWAQRLTELMGFQSANETEILHFLENADPTAMITAQFQILTIEESLGEGLVIPFGPTIEPYHTNGVFLIEDVPTLVRNAWGNNISIIIGATSMETLSMLPTIREVPAILDIIGNFETYVPRELNVKRGSEASLKYARMLKETYYGKLSPTVTNVDGLLSAYADLLLWHPAHRTIRYRVEAGSAPTYVYRFDADTENNVVKGLLNGVELYREPTHSDDFAHIFKTILHKPLDEMNQTAYDTLQLMVKMFTDYAIHGSPLPNLWLPVTSDNDDMLIGLNVREDGYNFTTIPEAARVKTFDRIFEMERGGTSTIYAISFLQISFMMLLKHFTF